MTLMLLPFAHVAALVMPAGAAEVHGRIVRVSDRDTITILPLARVDPHSGIGRAQALQ
jgi:hypothetical protein